MLQFFFFFFFFVTLSFIEECYERRNYSYFERGIESCFNDVEFASSNFNLFLESLKFLLVDVIDKENCSNYEDTIKEGVKKKDDLISPNYEGIETS